jgi:hypothetical protein
MFSKEMVPNEAITFMRKQAKKKKEENYDKNQTYETITCR